MKLVFFITIITALIVGFVAGGVYVYMSSVSTSPIPTPSVEPVIVDEPTTTPTPTSKPVVKLDSFSVSVLNGSGIIGAAGKVKDSLQTAGFVVKGTGNASSYNFVNTVIQVKPSVPADAVSIVKTALKNYVLEDGEALEADAQYDIVVTAGKN